MSAWVGWAALVVAVVAVPVTVWATRKWGNRNARLDLPVIAAAILPNGVKPGPLAVTYRDLPVDDPHLVTVALTNSGPRDLTSAHFDGAKPIVISFDKMFYGVTETAGNPQISSPGVGAAGAEATVLLGPALLKRGTSWSFTAVVDGPAEVAIDAPLIDTDIKRVEGQPGNAMKVVMSILGNASELTILSR
ncbi:hypothetical protein [Leifsonia sp. 21MFCrub1.1]|uniref:hypothetical protein n=1 Tax=Leifsonia sp. 21MFCrub1.1 TaxID=1798223 RepID=UPI00089283B0|nr:hypothetical protein [Leifsonia sp. 21MFCrub1.1]SEA68026.1 hypothetical protein SAMN04515680_1157 [Leifsonia sp. 21MFCrub1.1]